MYGQPDRYQKSARNNCHKLLPFSSLTIDSRNVHCGVKHTQKKRARSHELATIIHEAGSPARSTRLPVTDKPMRLYCFLFLTIPCRQLQRQGQATDPELALTMQEHDVGERSTKWYLEECLLVLDDLRH